jgi:predicted metal-dependent phosphoesterase TrpH
VSRAARLALAIALFGAAATARADELPWLRGSTHVHARPSGDSSEPVAKVIAWYERHGYDFIVLTDHNKVTEVAGDTSGRPMLHHTPLIVLAGVELTFNPGRCEPRAAGKSRCRIHVNALGVTARPQGKIEWANRKTRQRLEMYQRALDTAAAYGGLAQLNHPQWFWGMTAPLLTELAHRGLRLVEVANAQFKKWDKGDASHPPTEALWDAALTAGETLYAIASDDAHDYGGHGKWPAGGGWIMIHAAREPQAILDAIAAGRFYASTGVTLRRAEPEGGELVVEVDGPGEHKITFVENGAVVAEVSGPLARRALPEKGYVRAMVRRGDGAMAWVQPARR